jgi:hypothetical protein
LTTLLSLIALPVGLAIRILDGVTALALLAGIRPLTKGIAAALFLVILRLGIRVVRIGITHADSFMFPALRKQLPSLLVAWIFGFCVMLFHFANAP